MEPAVIIISSDYQFVVKSISRIIDDTNNNIIERCLGASDFEILINELINENIRFFSIILDENTPMNEKIEIQKQEKPKKNKEVFNWDEVDTQISTLNSYERVDLEPSKEVLEVKTEEVVESNEIVQNGEEIDENEIDNVDKLEEMIVQKEEVQENANTEQIEKDENVLGRINLQLGGNSEA